MNYSLYLKIKKMMNKEILKYSFLCEKKNYEEETQCTYAHCGKNKSCHPAKSKGLMSIYRKINR